MTFSYPAASMRFSRFGLKLPGLGESIGQVDASRLVIYGLVSLQQAHLQVWQNSEPDRPRRSAIHKLAGQAGLK